MLLQWENLLHLDTIKARSKPLAPPKKPEAAPFFLPTVPGLSRNPVFTADGSSKEGEEGAEGEAGEERLMVCSRERWGGTASMTAAACRRSLATGQLPYSKSACAYLVSHAVSRLTSPHDHLNSRENFSHPTTPPPSICLQHSILDYYCMTHQ
jgi:hypothetical protein